MALGRAPALPFDIVELMMTKQAPSTAEYLFYYVVIATSAVFILLPVVRAVPFAKLVVALMTFALIALWIRRDRKSGNSKLTVSEIYSRAKRGQRFASSAIELAATIATLIAFWLTI